MRGLDISMDYVSLGQRIRRKRRERHWTQAQLADAVNLSVSFMGHVERGTRKASLESLVALCNVLDASPNYLLEQSLTVTSVSENLSPQKRTVLRELVQHLSDNLDEWLDEDPLPDEEDPYED